MRFSTKNNSIHIIVTNNFKFKSLFNGEPSDYNTTRAFHIGFTSIHNRMPAYRAGIWVELFTSQPNYSKPSRNLINSDNGHKNGLVYITALHRFVLY
jgi:hypothetical protein